MNFLSIDHHLPRRFDAELDATRRDGEDGDAHLARDDDRLVETPGKNQHGELLALPFREQRP
jgi:hypothetical protein